MEARFEDVEHRLHLPEFKLQTLLMLRCPPLEIHILLPQVGEFRHSIRAIKRADWAWMVTALIPTAATFLFATVALRAASGQPLPSRRTTEAQLPPSFANRLAPGSVGGLGINE